MGEQPNSQDDNYGKQEATKSRWPDLGVSEALFLAGIPALAYAMSFLHEVAYCVRFEIPLNLIQLSTTTFLLVFSGVIRGLWPLLFTINMLFLPVVRMLGGGPIQRRLGRLAVLAFLLMGIALLAKPPLLAMAVLWGCFIVAGFFEFVFPFITERRTTGYVAKLAAQDTTDQQINDGADLAIILLGSRRFIIATIFALLIMSYARGMGDSINQRRFLIPESHPDTVVLRHYGDYFILAKVDRTTATVRPHFVLLPVDSGTQLLLQDIGPLALATDNEMSPDA